MARLNTDRASEVGRYSYVYRGRLVTRAWRSDGHILEREITGWRDLGRRRDPNLTFEDHIATLRRLAAEGKIDYVRVGRDAWLVPSWRRMEEWESDGIAETPDGCRVEPDGTCPHGVPSWLRLAGII